MSNEREPRKASPLEKVLLKVLLIVGILTPVVVAIFVIVEMISGASISEAIAEYELFVFGVWVPLLIYSLLRHAVGAKKTKK